MGNVMNVSDVVEEFLRSMQARHTLYTNKIHSRMGRPNPGSIKVVRDATRLDGAIVQIGSEDHMMRVSCTGLSEWLKDHNRPHTAFITALKKEFGAKKLNGHIGSGTQYCGARQYLWEIDCSSGAAAQYLEAV
jgi:hypothetical protein